MYLFNAGNLHQSQYCDRIKVLVEFLGTKLSLDELTTIWKMQVPETGVHCSHATKLSLQTHEICRVAWSGKNFFFEVREKSGNFVSSQGNSKSSLN